MKIYIVEGELHGMLVRYVVIDIDEIGATSLVQMDHPHTIINAVNLIGDASYYDGVSKIVCSEEP